MFYVAKKGYKDLPKYNPNFDTFFKFWASFVSFLSLQLAFMTLTVLLWNSVSWNLTDVLKIIFCHFLC